MADETPSASAQPGAAPQNAPTLNIIGQYIKDLSFENPRAPQSIMGGGGQPKFNVSINVGVNKLPDDVYAIELTFNAKAERDTGVLFNVELIYGGLFRLKNWTEQLLPQVLMIECPRILFPFARQVLSNVTQAGGFPPLLMDPVDFSAIYRQNVAQLQAQQKAAQTGQPEIILDSKKPN